VDQATGGADGKIGTAARAGSPEIAAERHCPLYRYLMDYVGHMTEAGSEQANRDRTHYRSIGHYTFPDGGSNPRHRPNAAT
jgi:hypothetical protein